MKRQSIIFVVLVAPMISFALSPCLSEIKKICPSSVSQVECLKANFLQFSPKCAKAVEAMIGPQSEPKETKTEGAATPSGASVEKIAEKPIEKPVEKSTEKSIEVKPAKTNQPSEAAVASNQLAFDLYKAISKNPESLFFSPLSIETALVMASAGARKETLEQMLSVLHVPNQAHGEFKKLLQQLKGNNDFQLLVANRLWAQSGNAYEPDFMKALTSNYGAEFSPLDFKAKPEPSREQINQWVQKQTMDKIKNLLPPNSVTKETDLVLTNAIYFKGTWSKPFKKENTKDDDFFVSADLKSNLPFMHLLSEFPFTESLELQYLRMPYQGAALVMEIILPTESGSLVAIEQKMSPIFLTELANQARITDVDVLLPKFKAQVTLDLNDTLVKMGMPLPFDKAKADFSGMRKLKPGEENLYISKVIHKAFVDVNEEGTEASAATAIDMAVATSIPPPPKIFRANRPFLYFIRDMHSGAILFMGRYSNP